jgi:hypothetical protein
MSCRTPRSFLIHSNIFGPLALICSEVGWSQTFSTNEIRDSKSKWLRTLVYYTRPRLQCNMQSLVVASYSSLDSKVPMFCECIHLRAMGSSTYGGQCLRYEIDIMWQCLLYRVVVEASFCEFVQLCMWASNGHCFSFNKVQTLCTIWPTKRLWGDTMFTLH